MITEADVTLWGIAALIGVAVHLVALRYVNALVSLSIGAAVAVLIVWVV